MQFPLVVSSQIDLGIAENNISSESYITRLIEEPLQDLGMSMSRSGSNRLLLQKIYLFRGFDRSAYLRDLVISVYLDEGKLRIRFESNTVIFLLVAIVPIVVQFSGSIPSAIGYVGIGVSIILYLVKYLVLTSVKSEVEDHLLRSLER